MTDQGATTLAHHVLLDALTMLTAGVASRRLQADGAEGVVAELAPQVASWINPAAMPGLVARLLVELDGVQVRSRATIDLLEARISALEGECGEARHELDRSRDLAAECQRQAEASRQVSDRLRAQLVQAEGWRSDLATIRARLRAMIDVLGDDHNHADGEPGPGCLGCVAADLAAIVEGRSGACT